MSGPRTGHRYRKLQQQVWREESHCCLCGALVDMTLRFPHRMSRTLEHLDKLGDGAPAVPDRSRVRLAHLSCNSSAGAAYGHMKRTGAATRPPTVNSERW